MIAKIGLDIAEIETCKVCPLSEYRSSRSDPMLDQIWGLFDMDAPAAWSSYTTGNEGVVVGVIDTGIDYDHPDLRNNMWVNPGEIPGNQ